MKNAFVWLGVGVLGAALAACGGGSSNGGPIPNPGPSNPPYISKLVFTGQLAGIQSDLRQVQSVSPMTSGTPVPIMIVSPIDASGNVGSVYGGIGGNVQAIVSPAPSAAPQATFSNTNAAAAFVTPQPSTSPQPLPSGVVAQQPIWSNGTPNVQSSGTASAAIGPPVNQTPTTAVYVYLPISLECVLQQPGSASAWRWDGAQWVSTTQAQADIYMSGPSCALSSGEANAFLHIPGGFTTLSTDVSFAGLNASQWANTQSSLDMSTATRMNPDGSTNDVIIGKTADGLHIFKLYPVSVGTNQEFSGGIEVSGSSVDGF